MITRESIKNSKFFTDAEKIVLNHMFMWEEWHKSHEHINEDVFILTNENGLIEMGADILFEAIYHLVDLGILRKRNCDAFAYEWNDKTALEKYI